MACFEVKKLYKHFDGVKAVNNISLVFKSGEITGLIGPNGSGKSTLINLITGVVPLDSGILLTSKKHILEKIKIQDVVNCGITRTFQEVRLFEQMSVLDNILIVLTKKQAVAALFEIHSSQYLQKAKLVLEKVGLWDKQNELAINLSYGQRKLLEIARVMAVDADVYLFDEPFAGLFPEMIQIVTSIICDLRDDDKIVVLVEHNMELIRKLSDHCIVMDDGNLLAQGKSSKVLARKDVIEAYLGE